MNGQPGLRLFCSHATNSGFLATCPSCYELMSKCIYCSNCVSDKKDEI